MRHWPTRRRIPGSTNIRISSNLVRSKTGIALHSNEAPCASGQSASAAAGLSQSAVVGGKDDMTDLFPVISRILVFPIKSLDGAQVERATVLSSGALEHDRTWALFDEGGRYVNGKRNAAVHRLRSQFDLERRQVSLRREEDPASDYLPFRIDDDRVALESWLSKYFERPIELRENPEAGFPDDTESPGPTFISVATLAEIARWFQLGVEQVRARLRTNVEIDGVPPFWEDRLFDAPGSTVRFRVGEAEFEGVNPSQRCVVPARDPLTGRNNETFVRRLTELRELTLPEWSTRERFNHFYRVAVNTRFRPGSPRKSIAIGDRIEILDRQLEASGVEQTTGVSSRPPSGFWMGELVVDGVRDETASVKTFSFRHPSDAQIPFQYLSGQFLTITVPDGETQIQRCYTVASSPLRRDRCEITVKRDGLTSSILHERLAPGDRLAVSGPYGRFTLKDGHGRSLAFIAGGVGITPLMSKIRYLVGMQWPGRIDLVYSVKSSDEIIFRRELEGMEKASGNLGEHVTVTTDDRSWTGAKGRVTKEWLHSVIPDIAEREAHICGPTSMGSSIQMLLKQLGVPADRVSIEAFGGPKEKSTAARTGAGRKVRFGRSQISASALAGQMLLDTALDAGVQVDYGCRAGVCGRCRAKLLEGEIATHGEFALTPTEKAAQFFLMCQAEAMSDVMIDCEGTGGRTPRRHSG
jgi:ferredoxin-NADP reductase/uncharacterized protein YcbX